MPGISWLAENQLSSQDGLRSVESVSCYVCMCASPSIKPLFYPTTIGCHVLSISLSCKRSPLFGGRYDQ